MNNFKPALFLATLTLAALPSFALGAPGCTADRLVCMEAVSSADGRGLELWLESKRPGAVTITLEQTAENLAPLTGAPLELNLKAAGRERVALLRAVKDELSWKHSFRFHCMSGSKFAQADESYLYAIPFAAGQAVRVTQAAHGRFSHSDLGNLYAVDFDVPENTPVFAAREGLVIEIEQAFTTGGPTEPLENANAVRIQHADGTIGEYGHLRFNGAAVKVGDKVKKGSLVGYSGNTGRSTGPHLHFDVHVPISGQLSRSIPIQFDVGEAIGKALDEGAVYARAEAAPANDSRMPASVLQ